MRDMRLIGLALWAAFAIHAQGQPPTTKPILSVTNEEYYRRMATLNNRATTQATVPGAPVDRAAISSANSEREKAKRELLADGASAKSVIAGKIAVVDADLAKVRQAGRAAVSEGEQIQDQWDAALAAASKPRFVGGGGDFSGTYRGSDGESGTVSGEYSGGGVIDPSPTEIAKVNERFADKFKPVRARIASLAQTQKVLADQRADLQRQLVAAIDQVRRTGIIADRVAAAEYAKQHASNVRANSTTAPATLGSEETSVSILHTSLPHLNVTEASLDEFFRFVQDVSGVKLDIDWESIGRFGASKSSKVSIDLMAPDLSGAIDAGLVAATAGNAKSSARIDGEAVKVIAVGKRE